MMQNRRLVLEKLAKHRNERKQRLEELVKQNRKKSRKKGNIYL